MKRRNFIYNSGLAVAGLSSINMFGRKVLNDSNYSSNRPALYNRTFTSEAVENLINKVKKEISDNQLSWIFENCYPNTLDTTVDYEIIDNKPDTFIITGDIDAMWLRDSTAQVWPYLPLINEDEKLKNLVKGLINRQVKCVLTDPYANAFYKDLTKVSQYNGDIPNPIPGVHERKWEIDSLCYHIRLSYEYYKLTGDNSIFDSNWKKSIDLILNTFQVEQRKNGKSPYLFIRNGNQMIDAPVFNGTGRPLKPNGLIASMFRPSDDATLFGFLIPSNIFAMISLRQVGDIYKKEKINDLISTKCNDLANEIEIALEKYAIQDHLDFGKMYAYEIDGFGNKLFMDDANVPSLMSLAYLNKSFRDNPLYLNTRKFLISENNPYFLKGKIAEGQASPHTGKDKIWPMGIILRAMTSNDDNEIKKCLKMLLNTHDNTGFMHEAFHKDNQSDFNRSWFAWANTLFGELIIKLYNERPHLLKINFS
jgi:meiotically up-regulated gene 157 (Mug157) protein